MITSLRKPKKKIKTKNINIAALYAQADEAYWIGLEKHLKVLTAKYQNVRIWSRNDVDLGGEMGQELNDELRKADVTLLLMSIDFINDHIINEETRILLDNYARNQNKEERFILPVIVNHFAWRDFYDEHYDIEQLRVFDKIVEDEREQNEVYTEIVQSLEKYIEEINAKSIRISIPTWIGYLGGVMYNNGFNKNHETSLYKTFQRQLRFDMIDSTDDLIDAWKSGETDMIWSTIDRLPPLISRLREDNPKVIFQASWSNGADAIIVRPGIESIEDLKGQKVLYPIDTPAQSFLKYTLKQHGMTFSDIQGIPQIHTDLDLLTKQFIFDEEIKAILLWSPYAEACLNEAPDCCVLLDSSAYPNLIADVLVTKEDYIQLNKEELITLFDGWLQEIHRLNKDELYKTGSVGVLVEAIIDPLPNIIPANIRNSLTESLNDYLNQSLDKVNLCGYGENLTFFGLHGEAPSGKALYELFLDLQFPEFKNDPALQWEAFTDTTILNGIMDMMKG